MWFETVKQWLTQNSVLIGSIAAVGFIIIEFAFKPVRSIFAFLRSPPGQRVNSSATPESADLRFVIVQGQSMVELMRRKDDRPNAQIITKWNVTNASRSGIPVRLLRAHLVQLHSLGRFDRDIVLTADRTGQMHGDNYEIPPGATRHVLITLFCTLSSEMLDGHIDLQIAAEDQLNHEHKTPSITLTALDPLLDSLSRNPDPARPTWSVYKYGYLLKCSHGYYFVYLQFSQEQTADRWVTEYEAGSHYFGEKGMLTGKLHGFETFEEAKAYCEKDAQDLEGML
jgi:hypothetical protein